jgi:hypothetical protein
MKMRKTALILMLLTAISGFHLIAKPSVYAQNRAGGHPARDGVYINLTEDFYRAMRDEGNRQTTYSTDKRNDYLRQIAVSTKFMVETNLQIIKQQEQMLRLLESIDKKRK